MATVKAYYGIDSQMLDLNFYSRHFLSISSTRTSTSGMKAGRIKTSILSTDGICRTTL